MLLASLGPNKEGNAPGTLGLGLMLLLIAVVPPLPAYISSYLVNLFLFLSRDS